MKKTSIISLILTTTISLTAYTQTLKSQSHQVDNQLLYALRIVESGGDDNAIGDGGKAIGPYQIWKVYWSDAIEYDPSIGGEYKDCFDREYSEKVVRAYMSRYATERRIGRVPTNEDMARIHNGGPNGYKKSSTMNYWKKVKKVLND